MLGVVVFTIGRQTETYIRRHIEAVLPGRTAVCALTRSQSPAWTPPCPIMVLSPAGRRGVELLRTVVGGLTAKGLQRLDEARLGAWIAHHQIEVVLCEYLPVALTVAPVCRRMRVPVIAHAHGRDVTAYPKDPEWSDRYRRELPLLDAVVVVSDAMRRRVLEFGVSADRIHIIPCGTEPSQDRVREYPPEGPFKAVAAGRLTAKKGPIFLLESFRRIRAAGVPVELFVLGDGALREPMVQFVRACGLERVVHLAGEVSSDEVRSHLASADLFLQHSVTAEDGDEEGLPVSILEAMAHGLPVVSTRHAGIPEVVLDGHAGLLVEPGDVGAMADKSLQLLRDPDLRRRLGQAGAELVSRRFTVDAELAGLRALLENTTPQPGKARGIRLRAFPDRVAEPITRR